MEDVRDSPLSTERGVKDLASLRKASTKTLSVAVRTLRQTMRVNTSTILVNASKQKASSSHIMATAPDWRTLTREQLALVEQRNADIERISKERSDARTEVTRLHWRTAEQDAAARNAGSTRQLKKQF